MPLTGEDYSVNSKQEIKENAAIDKKPIEAIDTEVITIPTPRENEVIADCLSDSTDGSYEIDSPDEWKKRQNPTPPSIRSSTTTSIPILKGKYYQDSYSAYWTGKWGMGSNLKISGVTSDFSYSIHRPAGMTSFSVPISGVYQGYFWIKFNPPRKIVENKMHIIFTENNGKYVVSGGGVNRLGPFDLQGTYDPTTQDLTCVKLYKNETKPKSAEFVSTSVRESIPKETRSSARYLSYVVTGGVDVPTTVCPALRSCYRLHIKLMNHKWAGPFSTPVDPVALNIPDYFDIVKEPMDLGTVQTKLMDGSLQTETEYVTLVRRVFDNAILYNKPHDDVSIMAKTLHDHFEREYEQMQHAEVALDVDAANLLGRRRSVKRASSSYNSYVLSPSFRQYSLRRSGSVVPNQKKPHADLPSDVEPHQYNVLEALLSRVQMSMQQMKTPKSC